PELNLAILENCTSKPREQQVWTYRLGDAPAGQLPLPVAKPRAELPLVEEGVVSVIGPQRVEISWTVPRGARFHRAEHEHVENVLHGYHVERAVVEVWSDDQLR